MEAPAFFFTGTIKVTLIALNFMSIKIFYVYFFNKYLFIHRQVISINTD